MKANLSLASITVKTGGNSEHWPFPIEIHRGQDVIHASFSSLKERSTLLECINRHEGVSPAAATRVSGMVHILQRGFPYLEFGARYLAYIYMYTYRYVITTLEYKLYYPHTHTHTHTHTHAHTQAPHRTPTSSKAFSFSARASSASLFRSAYAPRAMRNTAVPIKRAHHWGFKSLQPPPPLQTQQLMALREVGGSCYVIPVPVVFF